MFHIKVPIIKNSHVNKSLYIMEIQAPVIAKNCFPGQFITIDCNKFLRRPFSISDAYKNKLEILYKVIGEGTQFLATKKTGDIIDVFGPLGKPYKILDKNTKKFFIFIAGGTGIASLLFLVKKISNTKPNTLLMKHSLKQGLFFYGAKTKHEILNISDIRKYGYQIHICTEDSLLGTEGNVVELFIKKCNRYFQKESNSFHIYSAGPVSMLKKIVEICKKYRLKAQLSFEQTIACGVGSCRGCVIETANGYKAVCKDGPVFSIDEL